MLCDRMCAPNGLSSHLRIVVDRAEATFSFKGVASNT